MNILDYGEEGKGYAHNDYLALYKEENNAQLANKTDNSNKGLDSEALAKVKEQADSKKEDVKVASIGIWFSLPWLTPGIENLIVLKSSNIFNDNE